jgi:folate-binding protein YgfZ
MPVSPSYHAARTASAFIDLSARGRIAVCGDDRASYLQGLLTNDIAELRSGDGCYATYLTPQGRIVADMQVLNLGAELLLDVHPTVTGMLVDLFREFVFTEDVSIEDRTTQWVAFGVHGPESARVVSEVVRLSVGDGSAPVDLSELDGYPEYRQLAGRFESVPVVTARSNETGEVGFMLYVDAGAGEALVNALAKAGAAELDAATFDLLRVEAGRPAFPADLNRETIPLEAGIQDRAISMTKGCYVGQEVIVRILHRGQGRVGRLLVGLAFESQAEPRGEPPAVGAILSASPGAGDPAASGGDAAQPVGAITSSVWSPALDRPIALGYVKRELAEAGTKLVATDGERQLSGVVTSRPFLPLPTASPSQS